jgi:hypothetical protein
MTTWRMAFREGNRGPTLWRECLRLGVAAIVYEPLEKVDLSKYPEGEPESQWAQLSPTQKASLRRVAYEMHSGDVIYVKEGPRLVGKGYVTGQYTFDTESRIVDSHGLVWAHQVPVNWVADFPGASILLGAEQLTVKPLTAADVQRIESVVAGAAEPRPKYFARLCWNTRKWICPSGDASEIENVNTYAAKMGFGHEEWLFNFNWLVDGWKYSFLQPINRSLAHLKGKTIDVRLFTVGGTKGWFYVGEIDKCQVLTEEQARHALDQFSARGWLQDMEEHVRAVGGDTSGLQGSDPCNVFNIRFRKKTAELYDPPVPVDDGDAIRDITRYSLIPATSVPRVNEEWPTRVAATKERPTGKIHRKGVAGEDVELVHNAMQEKLAAALEAKYGKGAVVKEEGFVDIKLWDGKRLVFVEIKADPRPRCALREALGQLLEYEFAAAADGQTPTELVVAAPGELSSQLDLDYLHHLQARWSLPIRYVCVSREEGELEI